MKAFSAEAVWDIGLEKDSLSEKSDSSLDDIPAIMLARSSSDAIMPVRWRGRRGGGGGGGRREKAEKGCKGDGPEGRGEGAKQKKRLPSSVVLGCQRPAMCCTKL